MSQARRQPACAEGRQDREGKRAARRVGAQVQGCTADLAQRVADRAGIGGPHHGRPHPLPLAHEPRGTQLLLERPDLTADRTWVRLSSSAAAVMLPARATASNAVSSDSDGRNRRGVRMVIPRPHDLLRDHRYAAAR